MIPSLGGRKKVELGCGQDNMAMDTTKKHRRKTPGNYWGKKSSWLSWERKEQPKY